MNQKGQIRAMPRQLPCELFRQWIWPYLEMDDQGSTSFAALHVRRSAVTDGQRFLMLKSAVQPATQINIVLNWFEELKQKVPPGKQ